MRHRVTKQTAVFLMWFGTPFSRRTRPIDLASGSLGIDARTRWPQADAARLQVLPLDLAFPSVLAAAHHVL